MCVLFCIVRTTIYILCAWALMWEYNVFCVCAMVMVVIVVTVYKRLKLHHSTQHTTTVCMTNFCCYCYRLLCIIMWSSEWRQYCILDFQFGSVRQWCVVVDHIRVQWMIFSFSVFQLFVHWKKLEKGSNFPFYFSFSLSIK